MGVYPGVFYIGGEKNHFLFNYFLDKVLGIFNYALFQVFLQARYFLNCYIQPLLLGINSKKASIHSQAFITLIKGTRYGTIFNIHLSITITLTSRYSIH